MDGTMKNLIVIEELFLGLLCVFLFRSLELAWWWFPLFLLAPDLSMLAYLAAPRVGAFGYNLAHHKAVAVAVLLSPRPDCRTPGKVSGVVPLARRRTVRDFCLRL